MLLLLSFDGNMVVRDSRDREGREMEGRVRRANRCCVSVGQEGHAHLGPETTGHLRWIPRSGQLAPATLGHLISP